MTSRSIVPTPSRHASPRARGFASFISVGSLLAGLAIQTAAHAIPIGDFSWSEQADPECTAGLCGPFFTVGNFSADADLSLGPLGGSFLSVFVDLETSIGAVIESLGDIVAGSSIQSVDSLADLTVSFAALRLTFAVPSLPGSVRLLDEAGNVVAGLTAPGSLLIDYDEVLPPPPPPPGPVPVPEPSPVLLLLTGGLLGIALARRAAQRRALPENQG